MNQQKEELMPDKQLTKIELYEEIGHIWRHFALWREKILGGYLATLAGLGIAFNYTQSLRVHAALFGGGIVVSFVFWLLDYRNAQFINACQITAGQLEKNKGGYSAINDKRFEKSNASLDKPNVFSLPTLQQLKQIIIAPGYGVAISFLVSGTIAVCFAGLCIIIMRLPETDFWIIAPALVVMFFLTLVLESLRLKQRKDEENKWSPKENQDK